MCRGGRQEGGSGEGVTHERESNGRTKKGGSLTYFLIRYIDFLRTFFRHFLRDSDGSFLDFFWPFFLPSIGIRLLFLLFPLFLREIGSMFF